MSDICIVHRQQMSDAHSLLQVTAVTIWPWCALMGAGVTLWIMAAGVTTVMRIFYPCRASRCV